ncbi:MAG: carbon starvation protein A [Candidatus Neomarinimicrobiota bacterium]|nr:carbon starvation protein A [Candidatus Neomarinimicrobiota bacterium]
MNSLFLVIAGLIIFGFGYRFYASFLSSKIYSLGEFSGEVPAKEFQDGVDYVPTKKEILFGHHFTSIAGAAPIIGPCIAAYWGWLPAFLWVVLGAVLMGAVHDFGALVVSVREKGKTIADITGSVISPRIRTMFLFFVMMFSWLVLAVFAMAIAGLFVNVPTAVLPINIEILFAVIVGLLIYKKKMEVLVPSMVALILLYVFVYIGSLYPLSFASLGLDKATQSNLWIILLFIYSGIASLLPVWLLLQPRDYINSHQLIVGLGLIIIGIIIAQPVVDAPMIRSGGEGAPTLFPLLFVTIACGAISGFHGLVASGTTSKQINNIRDTKVIGYGAMLGEGTLALVSIIAAVAGISLVANCNLPSIGHVDDLSWSIYYDSWAHATTNKATAFVLGGGALIESLGISSNLSKTIMAVLVISFAATTLDTATRIQRFILMEIGDSIKIEPLKNRYVATLFAIVPALGLTLWNVADPSTGKIMQAGWVLWPIFGASNQMLAALTLMILCIYFWKRNKPVLPLIIPFIFLTVTTLISLAVKAQSFVETNRLLLVIDGILSALILWMLYEGWKVYRAGR